jgi:hypothetical protein
MDTTDLEKKRDKLAGKIDAEFVETSLSMQDGQIKDMVVSMSKELEDLKLKKKEDPKISSLAADLKALRDGYKDLINPIKFKIQFLLVLLEERGKL